ncbi:hypothetical protein VIGAN_03267400 [Vigna angularis var. angularis]|uniref:RNA helicase n=1 Tax=Vigna angularis var. angularis TaxID=157739 RepID=A0A0S3RPU6_PHAAN|nr:DEAD-box ATP-dependent RNA helicase 47A-like [Vigna angularis]BAT82630.1 hypothetical protein VIGAN_03267400 [Vigna angularis var. angularis]
MHWNLWCCILLVLDEVDGFLSFNSRKDMHRILERVGRRSSADPSSNSLCTPAGRTGRLGRNGRVLTICEEPEVFVVKKLQKQLGIPFASCDISDGKLLVTEEEKTKKQYSQIEQDGGDFRRGLISNALVVDLQLRIQSQGELMSLIHPDHCVGLLFLMQTPLTCCSWLKLLGGLMKKSVSF